MVYTLWKNLIRVLLQLLLTLNSFFFFLDKFDRIRIDAKSIQFRDFDWVSIFKCIFWFIFRFNQNLNIRFFYSYIHKCGENYLINLYRVMANSILEKMRLFELVDRVSAKLEARTRFISPGYFAFMPTKRHLSLRDSVKSNDLSICRTDTRFSYTKALVTYVIRFSPILYIKPSPIENLHCSSRISISSFFLLSSD